MEWGALQQAPLARQLTAGNDIDICKDGGYGILFGDGKPIPKMPSAWNGGVNAFMYLILLCWCFLGTSIIADMFMAAIEFITARRKVVFLPNGKQIIVKVWNGTVANLTLMALGSSAPEILMNVIDIMATGFHSGELGPSTIIGSAAFNTLVIIAICVMAIPPGQSRTISQTWPFVVTTSFSLFAYMWLVFILSINTPDKVDVGEGVSTFLFFPVLVVVAYLADVGVLQKCFRKSSDEEAKDEMQEMGLITDGGDAQAALPSKSFEKLPKLGKSRAVRRMESGMSYHAAKDVNPKDLSVGFLEYRYGLADDAGCSVFVAVEKTGFLAEGTRVGLHLVARPGSAPIDVATFNGFVEIPASERFANVLLMRTAKELVPTAEEKLVQGGMATARWPASEAGMMANWNCTPAEGDELNEDLEMPHDDFFVDIVSAVALRTPGSVAERADTVDLEMQQATRKVPIIEGQESARVELGFKSGGHLRFERVEVHVTDIVDDRSEFFKVIRLGGSSGELSCSWRTESDSAQPKLDYVEDKGVLTFPDGVTEQSIEVKLMHKPRNENTDRFFLVLEGDEQTLDESCSVCAVVLMERDEAGFVDQCIRMVDHALNIDAVIEGTLDWKDQFVHAVAPASSDDGDSPSSLDYAIHVIACPWKLFFAFVPPVKYCGGWVTFFVALGFVGLVTAIITDLASLFGCEMGWPKMITAITIVALGTSLPDTFASKLAAVEDDTADNAIGNVTGSNAVNVFLGLGLPWAMASIYWEAKGRPDQAWLDKYSDVADKYRDGGFIVYANDLTFSVVLFLFCSVGCFGLLAYRRKCFKAELGGPYGAKVFCATFFVVLWIFYISVASWKVKAGKVSTAAQIAAILVGIFCVVLLVTLFLAVERLLKWWTEKRHKELATALASVNLKKTCKTSINALEGGDDDADLSKAITQMRRQIQELNRTCTALEAQFATGTSRRKTALSARPKRPPTTSDFSESRPRAVTLTSNKDGSASNVSISMEKE